MKKKPIGRKPVTERSVPHDGFVIGSGGRKSRPSVSRAQAHDGIVLGGSITRKRRTPSDTELNALSSKRTDGKIV
ncbi:MAG: hypothetical protein ACE5EF_00050 [Dehalococcoidia bacterium]